MKLPLTRNGNDKLNYEDAFSKTSSPKYAHLAEIVHNGLDRMVMQSDLRDVYHGVHVIGFSNLSSPLRSELMSAAEHKEHDAAAHGIVSEFYLQLSDNNDEKRLVDVFKKYFRSKNYSLGGTDLFTSGALVDQMDAFGKYTHIHIYSPVNLDI